MRLDIVIDRQHVDDLLRYAGTSDPAEAARLDDEFPSGSA